MINNILWTIKISIYSSQLKYMAGNLSLNQMVSLFYFSSLGLSVPPGHRPQKGNLHTWWKSLMMLDWLNRSILGIKKNPLYLLIKYPNYSREAMKGKCRLTGDNYNCLAMSGWLEARAWKHNVFAQALLVLWDCWGSLIEMDFKSETCFYLNIQDFT